MKLFTLKIPKQRPFSAFGKIHWLFMAVIFIWTSGISGNPAIKKVSAADSADAIAIRVMPNVKHYSPVKWYFSNVSVQGTPQSLSVDGYSAVRDGRTVYVNAANLDDGNNDGRFEKYYSNIYIISYNQNSEQATADIFGQLLAHWKFNANLAGRSDFIGKCANSNDNAKNCSAENSCAEGYVCQAGHCLIRCAADAECPMGDYCTGAKARLARDTLRLSQLADLEEGLKNYFLSRGNYPKLESGSYLKGRTISTWPSWKENLGAELSLGSMPVDPLNKMGACATAGYDPITCWNEGEKKFINANFSMPSGSMVYYYLTEAGAGYKICAQLETKTAELVTDPGFMPCLED